MARTTTRRRSRRHNAGAGHHRRRRSNPATHRRRHYRRHNPGGGQIGGLVKTSAAVIGGAVGSKIIPQMILGSSNTGVMGYLANAISGGLLAWVSRTVFKDKTISHGVIVGTAVQIILRVMGDMTPFGQYLSLSGLGDYQTLSTGFTQPQRLMDGLHSSNVELPAGWGPGAMPLLAAGGGGSPAASAAGLSSLYSGDPSMSGALY